MMIADVCSFCCSRLAGADQIHCQEDMWPAAFRFSTKDTRKQHVPSIHSNQNDAIQNRRRQSQSSDQKLTTPFTQLQLQSQPSRPSGFLWRRYNLLQIAQACTICSTYQISSTRLSHCCRVPCRLARALACRVCSRNGSCEGARPSGSKACCISCGSFLHSHSIQLQIQ